MQNTLVGSSEKHNSKQSKWDTSYIKFTVLQKTDTKIYNKPKMGSGATKGINTDV